MKRYVIAVDEGTTSARAMLFDAIEKKFVAEDQRSIKQIYPRPSWVEEDADEIYVNTLSAIVTMCEKADGVNDVKGIGINRRNGGVRLCRVYGYADDFYQRRSFRNFRQFLQRTGKRKRLLLLSERFRRRILRLQ